MTARYREWQVEAALADRVACVWAARFSDAGEPHVDRVIPDGCIDLIFTRGRLLVAGPDTTSVALPREPGLEYVGLRFRPGAAPGVLGLPASELVDRRVEAEDLPAQSRVRLRPLIDALTAASSSTARATLLEAHAGRWSHRRGESDRLVTGAIRTLRLRDTGLSVAGLAAVLGVSERHLRRCFSDAVGYGPKMLQRVLRLRRLVTMAAEEPSSPRLASLAARSGYADQAHMTRECRALTGLTPSALVGYPVTAG